MAGVLARICADKRDEVARRRTRRPLAQVRAAAEAMPPCRGFADALSAAVAAGGFGLIAEIKKASPSKGMIREAFDPPALARAYAAGGAACLSVLTDAPYFQGTDTHLRAARTAVDLPVLRKDFMLEPYQIAESRAIGADCVLLIMAVLDPPTAGELEAMAVDLGMDVLAEVHDERDLERALVLRTPLIGINNRNLDTLAVDLAVTERLAPLVPRDRAIVCESGLYARADLERMAAAGAERFLIGESLMRQADVTAAVRALLAPPVAEPADS